MDVSRRDTSNILNPMNATIDDEAIQDQWNQILGEADNPSEMR